MPCAIPLTIDFFNRGNTPLALDETFPISLEDLFQPSRDSPLKKSITGMPHGGFSVRTIHSMLSVTEGMPRRVFSLRPIHWMFQFFYMLYTCSFVISVRSLHLLNGSTDQMFKMSDQSSSESPPPGIAFGQCRNKVSNSPESDDLF